VQREMDFNDGSAVRLTIARYYTPTGRSIQKPYSKGNEEYFKESDSRFLHGELYKKDSIKVIDSLKFKTKKGKIVYGGGGIVPDVFVPLEAEHGTQNISYLLQSGIVGHFVFEQLDKNRNAFAKLTFDEFQTKINSSDLYFKSFQKYLAQNGLVIDLSNHKALVKRYVNAEFARQLYGDSYYYKMVLKEDAMIKAVLNPKQ
jgi:carboxyl-terminal processing protease